MRKLNFLAFEIQTCKPNAEKNPQERNRWERNKNSRKGLGLEKWWAEKKLEEAEEIDDLAVSSHSILEMKSYNNVHILQKDMLIKPCTLCQNPQVKSDFHAQMGEEYTPKKKKLNNLVAIL